MIKKIILLLLCHMTRYTAFAQNVINSVKLLFVSGFFMSSKVCSQFRQKTLAFLCLLLAIIGFPGYEVKAQTTADYVWKNVLIGDVGR